MRKRILKRGKSYYFILSCFILLILLMGVISLGVSIYALQKQEAAADLVLDTLVKSCRDLICADMDQTNLEELYLRVRHGDEIRILTDDELTTRVILLSERENHPSSCFYLYLPDRGEWFGEKEHEEEVQKAVRAIEMSGIREDPSQIGLLFLNAEQEDPFSLRWMYPDRNTCFFMITYGRPGIQMDEDVLGMLSEPESYFYDSYGNVVPDISSSGKLSGVMDYYSLGETPDGSGKFSFEGVPYSYSYATLADSGCRFAVITKDSVIQERNHMLLLVRLTLGGTVCLGILLAFVLTKRLYRPMEGLMKQLSATPSADIPDEFQLLRSAFQNMGDTLSVQKELLASTQLLQLLHGYSDNPSGTESGRFFFDEATSYTLACVQLDEISDQKQAAELSQAEIAVTLEERTSSLLEDYGCEFLSVWEENLLLFLIHLSGEDIAPLSTILNNTRSVLETTDGFLVSIFVSRVHRGRKQLPLAYREMQSTREYAGLMEKYNSVICCDNYLTQFLVISGSKPDEESLSRFTEALTGGQTELLLEVFDQIVGQTAAQSAYLTEENGESEAAGKISGLLEQRMLLRILQGTTLSALLELANTDDTLTETIISASSHMDGITSLAQLRPLLAEVSEQIVPNEEIPSGEAARFEQIDAYMQQHFRDPNFSSYELADAFNTCPSNITRLFKKYKNCGFLEYLHQLRLNQARQLLTDTAYPVSDIAIMVGYSNALTLTRAFKRYLNTTPGAFRKQLVQ